jgi:hypothetical protein
MTNQEKKSEQWEKQLESFTHLQNYCTISARGLDDDSQYYHPTFTLDENVNVSAQSDIGPNKCIYALRFNIQTPEYFTVDIYETLLDAVIVGYHTNKDAVMMALTTLVKIRNHIRNLESYSQEYVSNLLLGESLEELGKSFIEEIKTTNKLVSFMKQNNQTTK